LIPDTVYHYRVVATNVAGTTFGVDHTFMSGKATPPGVVTGSATDVAQNTATIEGAVDTNGLPTSYGFEIATSTDYGPATGLGYIGAGSSEAAASLELTGLLPGTTYHYRLTASSVDGTVYGADETFTTSVFANTFAEPPAPLPFVAVPQIAFPSEAKQPVKKIGKTKPKAKTRKKTKGKKTKGEKAKGKKAKSGKK
jgi:phosphodiesterase/alkaline phosphatase D-like protein